MQKEIRNQHKKTAGALSTWMIFFRMKRANLTVLNFFRHKHLSSNNRQITSYYGKWSHTTKGNNIAIAEQCYLTKGSTTNKNNPTPIIITTSSKIHSKAI